MAEASEAAEDFRGLGINLSAGCHLKLHPACISLILCLTITAKSTYVYRVFNRQLRPKKHLCPLASPSCPNLAYTVNRRAAWSGLGRRIRTFHTSRRRLFKILDQTDKDQQARNYPDTQYPSNRLKQNPYPENLPLQHCRHNNQSRCLTNFDLSRPPVPLLLPSLRSVGYATQMLRKMTQKILRNGDLHVHAHLSPMNPVYLTGSPILKIRRTRSHQVARSSVHNAKARSRLSGQGRLSWPYLDTWID